MMKKIRRLQRKKKREGDKYWQIMLGFLSFPQVDQFNDWRNTLWEERQTCAKKGENYSSCEIWVMGQAEYLPVDVWASTGKLWV